MQINILHIRSKMIFFFLLSGIIPLTVTGYMGFNLTRKALIEQAFDKLQVIQELRGSEVHKSLDRMVLELQLLSQYQEIKELAANLHQYEESTGNSGEVNLETEGYKEIREKSIRFLKNEAAAYNFENFFLIDAEHGHVMLSLKEGWELGTNLKYGPFRDSNLATIWNYIVHDPKTTLLDFNPSVSDSSQYNAYIGTPLFDEMGTMNSIAVFKIRPELITKILNSRLGMGETGESYLVAYNPKDNSFSLRSDMTSMNYSTGYTHPTNLEYWEDAVRDGMGGGKGIYTDSYGKEVLVTYSMVSILDNTWYLISKIDMNEILSSTNHFIRILFYSGLILVLLIIILAVLIASNITEPIITSKKFAYNISHGNLDGHLDFHDRKDELGELGESLNVMAGQLKLHDWQKKGKEGLDDALRGEWSEQELSGKFIHFLVKHLEAQMGAVYLTTEDDKDVLELSASHAFIDRQGHFKLFKKGEGIIGQGLNEKEPVFYSHINEGIPALNMAVSERIPPYLVVSPLIFEGQVLGVFFVASLRPFLDHVREFLQENVGNASVLFNTTRSRGIISTLLESSQEQSEELRVINEELEEQTRALKESEEELQAQQEELRVTNEELEERTQALEDQTTSMSKKNIELTQAQKEIEKKARDLEVASKYKSEFLANMSHELRTPLNSILILSQLMTQNKNENLTEKQIESAEAIHSSGADLLKLINEILDLSKVEAGKIDINLENMDFAGMSDDLKRVFKDLAEKKGIEFNIIQDESVPATIHTDSHRLQQVMRNLLTNAFKFTEEKGIVTLQISTPDPGEAESMGRKQNEMVALRVKDTGIGIPEDKQAAIFEAFQQADGSTSRKYGGTGLGLSISRELSKLLGGNLTLISEPGKGSTFTMLTPRVCIPRTENTPASPSEPEENQIQPAQSTSLPSEPESPEEESHMNELLDTMEVKDDRNSIKQGDKSILIIEDDPRFVKILKEIALEKGYKCLIAEDGETGLHFADFFKPMGIILDIGLPGIDGWTVMERLKANPELRHIPVHFMSGSDNAMDAMKMGAVGYMTKPVSLEKIETAFSRIESMTSRTVRRLLVVEDDAIQRESIKDLIGEGDVETVTAGSGAEAFEELISSEYDCMILDLGLEDMSGYDLLEKMKQDERLGHTPVIIYTGRDLSQKDEARLRKFSESIIIKGAKSPERLLDETALFLHRVELNLPREKQKMLNINHDKDSVYRGKKILLVDDDMRNVFALTSVLEEKGIVVEVARNGKESLEKIDRDTKLVLMDIMMPVMDGYEAMRRIRQKQAYKKTPIIALTAKAMKGDRNKCIEAGASDYLAKPIDTDKLLSMLRVWLYNL